MKHNSDSTRAIKPDDVVYISGPISGIPGGNGEAFAQAEKHIKEKYGCQVLNPAAMPEGVELSLLYGSCVAVVAARDSDSHAPRLGDEPGCQNRVSDCAA